ncbi:hypothetical protein GJAV_G00074370 [Gymnothorax javanicus]|nr:hypothetical protein GJAV_G00074370 [Gymnothorax javanicus]
MPLKGTRFQSREDIMQNATAQLRAIPKEAFQQCFRQWQDRWEKCVAAQGDYFEGDWLKLWRHYIATTTALVRRSGFRRSS